MTKESDQKQDPSLKELVDLIKQESKHQKTNENGNVPRDRPYSKPKKKCFICEDDNACPKKLWCYNCQNAGHKFYDCPQKKPLRDLFETNK